DRLHQFLERLERRVTRAPPVRLEQEHLVREISGGLPAQVGNPLRGIALPGLYVADDTLLGRDAAPLDGGGVDPDRRGLARLARGLAAAGGSSGAAAAGPLASTTLRLSEPPMRRKIVRIGRSLLPVGGGLDGPLRGTVMTPTLAYASMSCQMLVAQPTAF